MSTISWISPSDSARILPTSTVPAQPRSSRTPDRSGAQPPATGEIVRDLYLATTPFCDLTAYDAGRFLGGAARTGLAII